MTALLIGVAAAVAMAIAFVAIAVPKLVFHMMKGPLEARIAEHYSQDEILLKDLKANFFGLESANPWQVRGNGALVLTQKHLHFFMFLPRRDIRIPLDAITDVVFTKRHAGKATIFDLLKVHFSADGKPDSIAWYLTDPHAWKRKIEELTK